MSIGPGVCMPIYVHVCLCVFSVCVSISMSVSRWLCSCISVSVFMCVSACPGMYTYVCMCPCLCVWCLSICVCMSTCVCLSSMSQYGTVCMSTCLCPSSCVPVYFSVPESCVCVCMSCLGLCGCVHMYVPVCPGGCVSLSCMCLCTFLFLCVRICLKVQLQTGSCWRFYLKSREAAVAVPNQSTGALSPASYISVSPALATQTPPEGLFRGYFKGKFVPSLPGRNPDTNVRPERGHRMAAFPQTAKVPELFFSPQSLSGNESRRINLSQR
uniref:Uncharacterized protein n=1 Tax=Serinus canaria TaxID=9135 RepID=A0A8C9N9T5_SERCA